MGSLPSAYSAKSFSSHLSITTSGEPGCCPGAAGWRIQTLPSVRAVGVPGRSESIGSTLNGSGSQSMSMSSMASTAVCSSTAATASTGSPW